MFGVAKHLGQGWSFAFTSITVEYPVLNGFYCECRPLNTKMSHDKNHNNVRTSDILHQGFHNLIPVLTTSYLLMDTCLGGRGKLDRVTVMGRQRIFSERKQFFKLNKVTLKLLLFMTSLSFMLHLDFTFAGIGVYWCACVLLLVCFRWRFSITLAAGQSLEKRDKKASVS